MRKIISRPNPGTLPELAMPVHVRSAGYNEAAPGWSEECGEGEKPFVQLFWCVQGVGEFRWRDRSELLRPGEVIYRLPDEEHCHRSVDSAVPWHYHWFTFDGPGAGEFMLSYGYPQRSLHAGECPAVLFDELENLLRNHTVYAQRHAFAVAAEILALAGNNYDVPRENDLATAFVEAAQKYFSDPETTAEELAKKLGVHRTTLNRVLLRRLSVSPKHYINGLRLRKGLALLLESNKPVKEIAFESGFRKTGYFCAKVRESTGLTPARYRLHASHDSL